MGDEGWEVYSPPANAKKVAAPKQVDDGWQVYSPSQADGSAASMSPTGEVVLKDEVSSHPIGSQFNPKEVEDASTLLPPEDKYKFLLGNKKGILNYLNSREPGSAVYDENNGFLYKKGDQWHKLGLHVKKDDPDENIDYPFVQSMGQTAPQMVMGTAGAAAGGAAGMMTGPAAPIVAPIASAIGSIIGMTAGEYERQELGKAAGVWATPDSGGASLAEHVNNAAWAEAIGLGLTAVGKGLYKGLRKGWEKVTELSSGISDAAQEFVKNNPFMFSRDADVLIKEAEDKVTANAAQKSQVEKAAEQTGIDLSYTKGGKDLRNQARKEVVEVADGLERELADAEAAYTGQKAQITETKGKLRSQLKESITNITDEKNKKVSLIKGEKQKAISELEQAKDLEMSNIEKTEADYAFKSQQEIEKMRYEEKGKYIKVNNKGEEVVASKPVSKIVDRDSILKQNGLNPENYDIDTSNIRQTTDVNGEPILKPSIMKEITDTLRQHGYLPPLVEKKFVPGQAAPEFTMAEIIANGGKIPNTSALATDEEKAIMNAFKNEGEQITKDEKKVLGKVLTKIANKNNMKEAQYIADMLGLPEFDFSKSKTTVKDVNEAVQALNEVFEKGDMGNSFFTAKNKIKNTLVEAIDTEPQIGQYMRADRQKYHEVKSAIESAQKQIIDKDTDTLVKTIDAGKGHQIEAAYNAFRDKVDKSGLKFLDAAKERAKNMNKFKVEQTEIERSIDAQKELVASMAKRLEENEIKSATMAKRYEAGQTSQGMQSLVAREKMMTAEKVAFEKAKAAEKLEYQTKLMDLKKMQEKAAELEAKYLKEAELHEKLVVEALATKSSRMKNRVAGAVISQASIWQTIMRPARFVGTTALTLASTANKNYTKIVAANAREKIISDLMRGTIAEEIGYGTAAGFNKKGGDLIGLTSGSGMAKEVGKDWSKITNSGYESAIKRYYVYKEAGIIPENYDFEQLTRHYWTQQARGLVPKISDKLGKIMYYTYTR